MIHDDCHFTECPVGWVAPRVLLFGEITAAYILAQNEYMQWAGARFLFPEEGA